MLILWTDSTSPINTGFFVFLYRIRNKGIAILLSYFPPLQTSPITFIPDLHSLKKLFHIPTAHNFRYTVTPTLFQPIIFAVIIIHTYCLIRIKIECKPDNLFTAACLPAMMQALRFNTASLKIINIMDMLPCIAVNPKAVQQCFMVWLSVSILLYVMAVKFFVLIIYIDSPCLCLKYPYHLYKWLS